MGELFDGWTWWVEDAYLLLTPEEEDYIRAKYITKNEEDEPKLTREQEIDLMNEQIDASEGFDIDFSLFRCLFNYHPLDFDDDDFAEPPETNGDLVKKLSEQSLDIYNQENRTGYEFDKVLYANFHGSSGIMFLITFQVKDPVDNLAKEFQARVRYTFVSNTDFVFCRPKPNQEGTLSFP
ncbi:unnamed protein product [Microthlaspi erraticum]|uniref:Cystatin domain-containing protein n=1 Tax=Microthlaspi erraticum TaxID=1685480 RepID=A0A6D2IC49_9BRAS|nr:unnamed protein product [Microthlaspi erraticum]